MGRLAVRGASVLLKSKTQLLSRVLTSLPSLLDDTTQSCGFKEQPHLTDSITLESARVSRLLSPLGNRQFKQNPAQSGPLDFSINHPNITNHPAAQSGSLGVSPFPHSSPIIHKILETQPLPCLAGPCHYLSQTLFCQPPRGPP